MPQVDRRSAAISFGSVVIAVGGGILGNYFYDVLVSSSETGTVNTSTSVVATIGIIAGILLLMEGLHIQYVDWIRRRIQTFEDELKSVLEQLFG